jgi:hypothetical protein
MAKASGRSAADVTIISLVTSPSGMGEDDDLDDAPVVRRRVCGSAARGTSDMGWIKRPRSDARSGVWPGVSSFVTVPYKGTAQPAHVQASAASTGGLAPGYRDWICIFLSQAHLFHQSCLRRMHYCYSGRRPIRPVRLLTLPVRPNLTYLYGLVSYLNG